MHFQAQMNLANFNPRPEKAGEGKGPGAADLKLIGKLHLEAVKELFHTDHGFALLEGLYDAEGNLRSLDFDRFPLTREIKNVRVKLSTQISARAVEFDKADFNEFLIVPEIGRTVKLTARLQMHPTPEQVGALFEWMATDLNVVVDHPQEEMPLEKKKGGRGGKTQIGPVDV